MQQQDPSVQWASHLARLDQPLRDAVAGALRHSISRGHPASERAVVLLIDYAQDEITADEYGAGILVSLGFVPDTAQQPGQRSEERLHSAPAPPRSTPRTTVSRDDAVQAYVTGQIDVSEFLRIARA